MSNLHVTKPDRNNGVVLLASNNYNEKIIDILKDHTKFTKMWMDWMSVIFKYQDKVSKFVDSIFKTKVIT